MNALLEKYQARIAELEEQSVFTEYQEQEREMLLSHYRNFLSDLNAIEDRWIPVSERLPTEQDGDENGKVLIYRKTNEGQKGMSKTIYDVFMMKHCDANTFWTKLPPTPQKA